MKETKTQTIFLKSTSSDHGHQGSTEINRSWVIEKTIGGADEVVLVKDYQKITFATGAIRDQSEDRYSVSVEDLIAFFEKNGTRTSRTGPA